MAEPDNEQKRDGDDDTPRGGSHPRNIKESEEQGGRPGQVQGSQALRNQPGAGTSGSGGQGGGSQGGGGQGNLQGGA